MICVNLQIMIAPAEGESANEDSGSTSSFFLSPRGPSGERGKATAELRTHRLIKIPVSLTGIKAIRLMICGTGH